MIQKKQFIQELKDSDLVESIFLVKQASVQTDKMGMPFMSLVLMDKTGEMDARVWTDVEKYVSQVVEDSFIFVQGKCKLYLQNKQIIIKKIRVLREDEVELKDYLIESELDADFLYSELIKAIHSMEDPYYKALAQSVFEDDSEVISLLKKAPAARSIHHAYPTGLLEHIVSISKILDQIASHYQPHVDRDLLLLGGFFHDIGKLWELSYSKTTNYTTEGRLIGHLVMGVELIDKKIREMEAKEGLLPDVFPEEKKLLIKHIVLSHHGHLEYGSPKRPKCLEAWIVHSVDNLDSKVNAMIEFMKKDETPGQWTGLNRNLQRFLYKPKSILEG